MIGLRKGINTFVGSMHPSYRVAYQQVASTVFATSFDHDFDFTPLLSRTLRSHKHRTKFYIWNPFGNCETEDLEVEACLGPGLVVSNRFL